jgi:hypothetical protein
VLRSCSGRIGCGQPTQRGAASVVMPPTGKRTVRCSQRSRQAGKSLIPWSALQSTAANTPLFSNSGSGVAVLVRTPALPSATFFSASRVSAEPGHAGEAFVVTSATLSSSTRPTPGTCCGLAVKNRRIRRIGLDLGRGPAQAVDDLVLG